MKHPKKVKKGAWFIKLRGSYIPVSWQGWLTYIPFVSYLTLVLVDATNGEHTALGAFYIIFPQWIAAAVVLTWLASKKS